LNQLESPNPHNAWKLKKVVSFGNESCSTKKTPKNNIKKANV